jgi:transcriptional regulator with XRE-family HTH domain
MLLIMGTRVKSRLKNTERRRHFIKEWRKYRELTQDQLADRVGVAVSTISQLEGSKQGYSQATLEALAEALRCEPADLLMRNPLQGDALWSIWEDLDQPAREQVTEIAKTFRRAS